MPDLLRPLDRRAWILTNDTHYQRAMRCHDYLAAHERALEILDDMTEAELQRAVQRKVKRRITDNNGEVT